MYHEGELAVQQRMGQADAAQRVGRIVKAEIPRKAADFLSEQQMVVLAAMDATDRMWVGMIVGPPGFVHADDPRTITVERLPSPGDPLTEALRRPRRVGMLALHPESRRRMRVNGSAEPVGAGLRLHTDQVYSNCPKYISRRSITEVRPDAGIIGPLRTTALNARQEQAISAADTFFVGSADVDDNADASHRGGNPGFLQVISPSLLRWPDYPGNAMFMTLGNIAVNPRCGLLIPDWRTGGTLQLTGTAAIVWGRGSLGAGAQCAVDFTISEVVEIPNASPLRWGGAELSPVNPTRVRRRCRVPEPATTTPI